jgi:hypothetical protein
MKCNIWEKGKRCDADANFWLIAPSKKKNPGGLVCKIHGEDIIKEYKEKLGEVWELAEINQEGDLIS